MDASTPTLSVFNSGLARTILLLLLSLFFQIGVASASAEEGDPDGRGKYPWGWGMSYHFVPGTGNQYWEETSIGDIGLRNPTHVLSAYLWIENWNYAGVISSRMLLGARVISGSGNRQIQDIYGYEAHCSSSITVFGAIIGYGYALTLRDRYRLSVEGTFGALFLGWATSSLSVDIHRDGQTIRLYDGGERGIGYVEMSTYASLGYEVIEDCIVTLRAGYDLREGISSRSPYRPMLDGSSTSRLDGPAVGMGIMWGSKSRPHRR
jgi:hypothetical protein